MNRGLPRVRSRTHTHTHTHPPSRPFRDRGPSETEAAPGCPLSHPPASLCLTPLLPSVSPPASLSSLRLVPLLCVAILAPHSVPGLPRRRIRLGGRVGDSRTFSRTCWGQGFARLLHSPCRRIRSGPRRCRAARTGSRVAIPRRRKGVSGRAWTPRAAGAAAPAPSFLRRRQDRGPRPAPRLAPGPEPVDNSDCPGVADRRHSNRNCAVAPTHLHATRRADCVRVRLASSHHPSVRGPGRLQCRGTKCRRWLDSVPPAAPPLHKERKTKGRGTTKGNRWFSSQFLLPLSRLPKRTRSKQERV